MTEFAFQDAGCACYVSQCAVPVSIQVSVNLHQNKVRNNNSTLFKCRTNTVAKGNMCVPIPKLQPLLGSAHHWPAIELCHVFAIEKALLSHEIAHDSI